MKPRRVYLSSPSSNGFDFRPQHFLRSWHYGNKRPTSFYQTAHHGCPSGEQQDAINTLCKEIKFKYPERNKSAARREERADQVSGPQTAIKRADVQQIVRRASCSTNVISLSLVIISRSVGREIQIRLPEGRERKNSWTWYKKFTHCTRGGRTHDSLHTRDWRIYRSAQTGSEITIGEAVGSGGKSSVLSEDVFLFFHVLFLWMSWCLRLLSRGSTDGYLLYSCWTVVTMHRTSN